MEKCWVMCQGWCAEKHSLWSSVVYNHSMLGGVCLVLIGCCQPLARTGTYFVVGTRSLSPYQLGARAYVGRPISWVLLRGLS